VSSYSTVHGGEVRSRGEIGRRTRGGGAHREAAAAAMAAQLAVRSGRGVDVGADEWSTTRGGIAQGELRGRRGRNGRGGIGRRPFSGRRHVSEERDGWGVRSARGHVKEEEGGLATACARAGRPGHERVWSGGGSPGTATSDHAQGRQGKREKGERVGEAGRWASPWSGSRLSAKERERRGENGRWAPGCG
jgi:hypothetical protein